MTTNRQIGWPFSTHLENPITALKSETIHGCHPLLMLNHYNETMASFWAPVHRVIPIVRHRSIRDAQQPSTSGSPAKHHGRFELFKICHFPRYAVSQWLGISQFAL